MKRFLYKFVPVVLSLVLVLTGCKGIGPLEEGASVGEVVDRVETPQSGTVSPPREDAAGEETEEKNPAEEMKNPLEQAEKEPDKQQTEQSPDSNSPQDTAGEDGAPEQNRPDQPQEEQPEGEGPEKEESGEGEKPEEEPGEEPGEEPEEEELEEGEPEEEEEEEDADEEEESGTSGAPVVPSQPQKPVAPTPSKIKVASYNIKALMYGEDTEGIIQELREMDADIVGLQEVDKNTSRSKVDGKKVHQVEMLAKELGYPYWSFDKLINYQGGEYGMAILSRYPIISSQVVQYEAQEPDDSHVRKYARHLLKVGSKDLAFYNTHLCIRDEEDAVSKLQLKEVTDRMRNDGYSVLTGDFNMQAPTAASVVAGNSMLTILNDGGPLTGKIGKKDAKKYIDNIIISKMMSCSVSNAGTGIEVNETEYSDHNLIYTYVSFK